MRMGVGGNTRVPMDLLMNKFLPLLGLQEIELTNQATYIKTVRNGLPGHIVKHAVKIFDNRELFVRLFDTTSNNLSQYYHLKKMNRTDTEKLLDTLRLFTQAQCTLGDIEKAREWIKTPIAALTGEKPEDLFDTFEGRHWVSQVLRNIEYGEFV